MSNDSLMISNGNISKVGYLEHLKLLCNNCCWVNIKRLRVNLKSLPEANINYTHEDILEKRMAAIKFCNLKNRSHIHIGSIMIY